MKKKLCILFAIIIFIVGVFQYNKIKIRNNCSQFITQVNENKTYDNEDKTIRDLSRYMYEYKPKELGIPEDKLKYITYSLDYSKDKYFIPPSTITKEEAISDMDFIFDVIKYSYGGYLYFGGDLAFSKAKNNIISEIKSYDNDMISVYELRKLILKNIEFIKDNHFTVNNDSPMSSLVYYSNEEVEFKKSEEGYYILKGEEKYYIQSIDNNKNIDTYLKLSINKSGDLCYYLGILDEVDTNHKLKIVLKSSNNEEVKHIKLSHNNKSTANGDYKYSVENKIPIVTMPRMYEESPEDKISEQFIESANSIKKYPIAIIDIRGNPGGKDIMPMEWFKNYTGVVPEVQDESIVLYSKINNYVSKKSLASINYEEQIDELKDIYNKELERVSSNENKWYSNSNKGKRIKNDKLIFVLIDECVESSGEGFVRSLKTMDNVILVGTNTSGAFVSTIFSKTYLPNSKIQFEFGDRIINFNDMEEGVGFTPDIWSNDSDILQNVITLANKLRNE